MSSYYQNENERRYNQKRSEQEAFDFKMDVARNMGKNMTGSNYSNYNHINSKNQQFNNPDLTSTSKNASFEYYVGIFTLIGSLIFLIGSENMEFLPAIVISTIGSLVVAFAVKIFLRIIVPILIIALVLFFLFQFIN